MVESNSIESNYQQRITQFASEKRGKDKQIFWISILRLGVFILLAAMAWLAFKSQSSILWGLAAIALGAFMLLMKYHGKLFSKRQYLIHLININEQELSALGGDISHFDGGDQYQIPDHDFSLDLDVFGNQSIYQLLNRTATSAGAKQLATWLNSPLGKSTQIAQRQEATKELAPLLELRQRFRATGLMVDEKPSELEFLTIWKSQSNVFYPKMIFKVLIYLLPAISISIIMAFALGFLAGNIVALSLLINLGIVGIYQKKVNEIHRNLSRRIDLLNKYVNLFQIIEKQAFNSALLKQWQEKLKSNNISTSGHINQLAKIVSMLDSRLNILVGIVLNAVFVWDIRLIFRMEKWKEQHAAEMEKWFEVIADFDALCGLANVSYNNPHWTFPQLSDDNTYKMNQIRHPLMKTETCVPNDFEVNKVPALQVITGANMAGKSTYLRTIGSNMILAMVGAPVHASAMIFTPIKLISSLRTTDSLAKSESYFYAEIKRLQMIVNRLKRGEKMLILLDEILKGTNSKDKEQGSRQLLLQLLKLKAIGIIATHDISLGEMSKTHGEWISNQCFEVDIMDDQLVFDYRIRSGVAQNMNASFLLKKMGITA